jgi:hypothetical protein
MKLRSAALALALLAVPAVATAALVGMPTARLTLTRAGAPPEVSEPKAFMGGGVKILATSSATVGPNQFRTSGPPAFEIQPVSWKNSFSTKSFTSDLSPALEKVGPIEVRVTKIPTSTPTEQSFRPGQLTFAPVRFTLAHRKADTAMGEWMRATLAGKGTRRTVTLTIGSPAQRRIVLRDALPVAYTAIDFDLGTFREVIELAPARIEVLGPGETFGLSLLDATFRGQAPTAQLSASVLEGGAVLRAVTYTNSFVTAYRGEGFDVTAGTFVETIELQPGPGSTAL